MAMVDLDFVKAYVRMCNDGFRQAVPRPVKVTGESGRASLEYTIANMQKGGFFSEYDQTVADTLAWVVTGGDVPKGSMLTEAQMLNLEAEGVARLVVTEQARERVRSILTTGKPLRN